MEEVFAKFTESEAQEGRLFVYRRDRISPDVSRLRDLANRTYERMVRKSENFSAASQQVLNDAYIYARNKKERAYRKACKSALAKMFAMRSAQKKLSEKKKMVVAKVERPKQPARAFSCNERGQFEFTLN